MPTRNGRNGMIFTKKGIINIRNNKWSSDFSPIDEEGTSDVDGNYSKAYLRHLFQTKEMLGAQLSSIHNLAFYLWLVGEARNQIMNGTFRNWKDKMVLQLGRRL
jgi:queuine tRNA-ribosyltransferase